MGDTITEECKENPRVRCVGLQAQRGGPPSSFFLFLNAGTEPVKEQGMPAAHQQSDTRGRARVGGQK